MNPYIADILSQPSILRDLLRNFPRRALEKLGEDLKRGKYDRILITGMGSSLIAAYPAVIRLSSQPVPVQYVNAAELLHFREEMIGSRTLIWMNSQSGRSVELVNLLDHLTSHKPMSILTFVNDRTSPMAIGADLSLDIHAGQEATVSTKTYMNMLAINLLASVQLTNGNMDEALQDLFNAADALEIYLSKWETHIDELDALLEEFNQLFILGRGPSMAAVGYGSLINKEAAKSSFEGMNSADFRHGPLELASPGLAALIFAGSPSTANLNRRLGVEIASYGGRVLWADSNPDQELTNFLLPKTSEFARSLAEPFPVQMLSLLMARRKGIQAGQFRYVGKVTNKE